jgi:formiminoglutamate deiminase
MSIHKDDAMIFAEQACLPDGWVSNVRLTLRDGALETISPDAVPFPGDVCVKTLLPALSNLHSHSFQRAMAGMTEHRAAGQDSFWTWRELMYRFTARLSPEQVRAIAAQTFMEMQEAGFAAVGEFHYLHHQPGGAPYDDPAEMTGRIYAAAEDTGIGLTHLPVFYAYGGAGKLPLSAGQLRFGSTADRYAGLLDAARSAARRLPSDTRVGIAPHSLRATSPDDLAAILPLAKGNPIHIHIAEQPQEVADITSWLGARPVDWLLDHADLGPDWCPVHATHMTPGETRRLAETGAAVGLCPITEANLGDGPFDGPGWRSAGGRFGVGSDSNVRISMVEELRTLEYSQRLRDLSRNVMVDAGSTGSALYMAAARGGAQALGRNAGQIAPGCLADLTAIDHTHPALCALNRTQLIDGLVFAAPDSAVTDVWSAGRHMVREGRHIHRDRIVAGWRNAVATLMADL